MRQQRHRAEQRSAFGLFPAAGAAEAHADQRRLVSPRLRADFSNGDQFYAKAGQVIDLPERWADRPGREFLEWHLDEVFLTAAVT